ncbi:MAG: hypothetical protein WBA89_11220 [Microcoleus sp.]|uniref:hypothetical protein n=1 Tax=Microcoleus sp. TaxID=44472 RepID=UPI003C76A68E
MYKLHSRRVLMRAVHRFAAKKTGAIQFFHPPLNSQQSTVNNSGMSATGIDITLPKQSS